MKVLVWGAGAIGGTLGAYFVRAGHEVTFVDIEPEHVEAINARGLHLSGPINDFRVEAKAFTPKLLSGHWHCVLLCTKAQHTKQATQSLLPHLADNGYIVSAQNGLNEHVIARLAGQVRTVGCFVNFGADYHGPGEIYFGGRGAVVLGELDGQETARLRELHTAFLAFDDQALVTSNIWGFLWSKLAVGAMLFATALTNASIADALASPSHRDLFLAIPAEVLHIAQARGIEPQPFNGFKPQAFSPPLDRTEARASLEAMVAFNRRSTKTHSGIWRDLAVRKRRTEADAQLGPIVALGEEVGLRAPLIAQVINLIHEIEEGNREQGWHNLDILNNTLADSVNT